MYTKSKKVVVEKLVFFLEILSIISCSNDNNGKSNFVPTTRDTIELIQTMLDNKKLNDTLFIEQISQDLILQKDTSMPPDAIYTYKGKQISIRQEKIKSSDIDYKNPRFIIAFGDCIIGDSTAKLNFGLPDVNVGVYTFWKRKGRSAKWVLTDWNSEQY